MKNLLIRTFSGIMFVVVMTAGMLHPITFLILFSLITFFALKEFYTLIEAARWASMPKYISIAAGVYLFIATYSYQAGWFDKVVFAPYILLIFSLFVAELYRKQVNPIHNLAFMILGQCYIALPFALLNEVSFSTVDTLNSADMGLLTTEFNWILPVSIFYFLWSNDSGAYAVGSLFGKHRLFERISPKKSWEGFFGGIFFASLFGWLFSWIDQSYGNGMLSIWQWIVTAQVTAISGTLGDLNESLLKRHLGIKDSGYFLAGHGGVLDRFDSSILAIPAVALLMRLFLYS